MLLAVADVLPWGGAEGGGGAGIDGVIPLAPEVSDASTATDESDGSDATISGCSVTELKLVFWASKLDGRQKRTARASLLITRPPAKVPPTGYCRKRLSLFRLEFHLLV